VEPSQDAMQRVLEIAQKLQPPAPAPMPASGRVDPLDAVRRAQEIAKQYGSKVREFFS
jgi:hypothetical protein